MSPTCLLPVPIVGAHLSCIRDPSRWAGGSMDLSHFCGLVGGGGGWEGSCYSSASSRTLSPPPPHIPCSQKKVSTCCQPALLSRWPCHIGPQLIHRTQHRSLRHPQPACLPHTPLSLRRPLPSWEAQPRGRGAGRYCPLLAASTQPRLMAKRKQTGREGPPPFLHAPSHGDALGWWLLVEAATPSE